MWFRALVCVAFIVPLVWAQTPTPLVDVFASGEGGYMCIRIPVIVETPTALVAMAEARGLHSNNYNCCVTPVEDFPWCTDKDIVMKLSTDGGNTWGPLITSFETDSQYFYSNPTPALYNGDLFMLFTRCEIAYKYSQCQVFYAYGPVGGPWKVLQQQPAPPSAPLAGPPSGLYLSNANRLIFPIATSQGTYVIYVPTLDTQIPTNLTAGEPVPGSGGESQIAQLPDGRLIFQMRDFSHGARHYFSYSNDSGVTWAPSFEPVLPETNCQASIIYSNSLGKLLFSTPAANVGNNRSNMTIYTSSDSGVTFEEYVQIYNGPSAYSAMIELSDGRVGVFFERGVKTPYEALSISFFSNNSTSQIIP